MLVAEANSDLADLPVTPENFRRFLDEVTNARVFKGEVLIDQLREGATAVSQTSEPFAAGGTSFSMTSEPHFGQAMKPSSSDLLRGILERITGLGEQP